MSKLDQLPEEYEATRELIGKPPPVIVLYGSGLILWVVIVLLAFSWFIQIPDRITGAITLGADRQVAQINAPVAGQLYTLTNEQQLVQKDSPLALIETPQNKQIIKSPATGRVTFLYKTTSITKGDLIAAVVPPDTPAMYGRMLVPADRAMGIRVGLKVSATIKGAKNQEAIHFSGTTTHISLVPDKKHYIVTVIFPDGIHLPAGALPAAALLEGEAQLVTGNRRLIQRIFGYFN
jgi:hypothetical protein